MKRYSPPADKSITIRALLLGAVAEGDTLIRNPLTCGDTAAARRCLRGLGVKVEATRAGWIVHGRGLRGLKAPRRPLDAGESAATARLLAGLLAGQDFAATLTGAPALRRRPMARVAGPLGRLGAKIQAPASGGLPLRFAPARLKGIKHRSRLASAQVKSAVLLAGLYAAGETAYTEPAASRDHTERLLEYFGAKIKRRGLSAAVWPGPLKARPVTVPGDLSSAAPFIAAALLAGRPLKISGVGLNPGRLGFITALRRMGAKIELKVHSAAPEPAGDISVTPGPLKACRIRPGEVPALIDELPLLALLGAAAAGTTVIRGAGELRHKESDRISSTLDLLRRLGAGASFSGGALKVFGPAAFRPASVNARGDHRIAMAAAAAALRAGEIRLSGAGCVAKSYPGFFRDFAAVFG